MFSQPLRSIMQMLKLGRGYFAALPANNWSGHGFYQFTPELFYRTFSEENGFRVSKLLVAPACVGGRWLDGPACEVMDPKSLGWVEVSARREIMLLLQAEKIAEREVSRAGRSKATMGRLGRCVAKLLGRHAR
jgi:hypothetical protein